MEEPSASKRPVLASRLGSLDRVCAEAAFEMSRKNIRNPNPYGRKGTISSLARIPLKSPVPLPDSSDAAGAGLQASLCKIELDGNITALR